MVDGPEAPALQDAPAEQAEEGIFLEPPRVYLMHFMDDYVFRPHASFLGLSELLDPCRVIAFGYDEEALKCETLPEVAALFKRRLLDDIQQNPTESTPDAEAFGVSIVERIVLIGYAFGAIVAHQVALQLQKEGRSNVCLVLLDSEVAWPPSYSAERMGGYQWLGGELEAALLACRAMGSTDFARQLALELVSSQGMCDVDEVLMRVFWELAPGGMTQSYFQDCIMYLSLVLERMNYVAAKFGAPERPFEGPSLLLLSTSREFREAEDVNRKHCTALEVAHGRGNHYNFVQGERARSIIGPLSNFLINHGFFGTIALNKAEATGRTRMPPPPSGLEILSEGDDPLAPTIYISHDVRQFITKEWKEQVASLLAPCRVVMLQFDAEAYERETMEDLAELYQRRIFLDISARSGAPPLPGDYGDESGAE